MKKQMTLVFQGDSITDAGKNKENNFLGSGYVSIVAKYLDKNYPNVKYINSGVSGDTSYMMLLRLQKDTLAYNPDVVTVMIGINDVWRKFDSNMTTTDVEYEKNCTAMLKNIKDSGAKIIMLQPYILRFGAVTDEWESEFQNKKKISDRLAEKFADDYIRTADIFDELVKTNDPTNYSQDGVHPCGEGCEVISSHLINSLKNIF